jgi:hypothetical protein
MSRHYADSSAPPNLHPTNEDRPPERLKRTPGAPFPHPSDEDSSFTSASKDRLPGSPNVAGAPVRSRMTATIWGCIVSGGDPYSLRSRAGPAARSSRRRQEWMVERETKHRRWPNEEGSERAWTGWGSAQVARQAPRTRKLTHATAVASLCDSYLGLPSRQT